MTLTIAKRFQIFIPFALGVFISYLYRVINAAIAPNLVADIEMDAAQPGLLTAAYFITFASIQLPLGVLLVRFGLRRLEAGLLMLGALGAIVFAKGIITYAALSQHFPRQLAGRVNTILNLFVFVVAFLLQWGVGAVLNCYPMTDAGNYAPAGFEPLF